MIEKIIQDLWQASESGSVCRISLEGEALPRVIHPYGVCKTSAGKIVLVCWQTAGYTSSEGKEGFRNLILGRIVTVEVLDQRFSVSKDFYPEDNHYQEWVYHI